MVQVDLGIEIDAPIEEVFEFTANNENDPIWLEGVVSVRKTSEGPIGVGSTFVNRVKFLGISFDNAFEVVEFEPNTRTAIVQETGLVPFRATNRYRSIEGGTLFSMMIEAEPGGVFALAKPLVRRQLNNQYERNLKNLKALLERQGE